jgi:hypothetical protein
MLAAVERTTDRRAERHPSVRSQQKLALDGDLRLLSHWCSSLDTT